MKKILLPILSLTLAACSSSQVTVTRYAQMTVTSSPPTATPIPTPTLHPQFIALQESIAASGERFTLLPDGTIQDGAKTVPGLFVDKTGAITLRGLSSQVTLDAADVSFDDEKGVSVEGYTLDEATGKWGVAQEIVLTPSGIGFELGEQIEGQPDGVREVVDFIPPAGLDSKEKIAFEDQYKQELYGAPEGTTQWVRIPLEDGKFRVVLQNIADPTIEIAEMGSAMPKWDYSKMKNEDGSSWILDVGRLVPMGPGFSIRSPQINSILDQLGNRVVEDVYNAIPAFGTYKHRRVVSLDGSQGVLIAFKIFKNTDGTYKDQTTGVVCFRDNQNKDRFFYAVNFDEGQ